MLLVIMVLLQGFSENLSKQEREYLLSQVKLKTPKSSCAAVVKKSIKYFNGKAFWPMLTFCSPNDWVYCKHYSVLKANSLLTGEYFWFIWSGVLPLPTDGVVRKLTAIKKFGANWNLVHSLDLRDDTLTGINFRFFRGFSLKSRNRKCITCHDFAA